MTKKIDNKLISGAFFDLDKTIIAKSSMLAFSKTFRKNGLLSRRALVQAAYAQVVFQLVGANENKMERLRGIALELTKGWNHDHVKDLVNETIHDVVVPIIYEDAIELIDKHKSEGHLVFIVSIAPIEVVEPIAFHLGVTDFIATTARLDENGNYSGELDFYSYGSYKPQAVLRLAKEYDLDLEHSFAYSDSITDVPLLECVGNPIAVNPDKELYRVAKERGWEIKYFSRTVSLWDRLPVRFFQNGWVRIISGTIFTLGISVLLMPKSIIKKK